MDWQSSSEIVTGLVLDNRLSVGLIREDLLYPPYDDIIKCLKHGDTQIEDIIEKVGLMPVQASLDAAKTLNGLGEKNWLQILENSAVLYSSAGKLEKLSRQMKRGEPIDFSELTHIANQAQQNIAGDFVPLSEVESSEMVFKETGFAPIDDHLGGLPATGQVLVAGSPGSGKTTWMSALCTSWVQKHPNDTVAIFSIEMMLGEIAERLRTVSKLNKDQEDRIMLNENPVIPEEVISKAAGIENLGLVCVDFADLLIRGETTESAMAHVYRTFMLGSKTLGCPIVVLSQLNRSYVGGIPRPAHIRYTSLAEALSWMLIMLYNPTRDFYVEDKDDLTLPLVDNTAFMVAWKVRGGFRKHPEDSPGAIMVQWSGKRGWRPDHSGKWFSLRKS